MSFPNSPNFNSSPEQNNNQQRPQKPKLRSVRLELPSKDFPKRSSPNPTIIPNQPSGSFGSLPNNNISVPIRARPSLSTVANGATILSPSIFYEFPENTEANFILDVVTPDNAFPFITQPQVDVINPRFLLYTMCSTSISTSPVKIILNGTTIFHWITDPRPLDITDLLVSFGQQNWLIIETGNFVVPFAVIGVWSSFLTLNDIIHDIDQKEHFLFNEIAAICPITGQQIEIPSKGINCKHDQCFDLVSYITTSQALGIWMCPICQQQILLSELRIGQRPNYSFNDQQQEFKKINNNNDWNNNDQNIITEVESQNNSIFWVDDEEN